MVTALVAVQVGTDIVIRGVVDGKAQPLPTKWAEAITEFLRSHQFDVYKTDEQGAVPIHTNESLWVVTVRGSTGQVVEREMRRFWKSTTGEHLRTSG